MPSLTKKYHWATKQVLTEFAGHRFGDPSLLQRAFRHRSMGIGHNERFEFLGDAVLGSIIAEALFQRWPVAREGQLTRARSRLVRRSTLAKLARQLDIGKHLELGPSERKSGGRQRDSILADAVEAFIAAVYLDAGYDACRSVVLSLFQEQLQSLTLDELKKDAKTQLQEWLQAQHHPLPTYELIKTEGQAHQQTFTVSCTVSLLPKPFQGRGESIKDAEQQAASQVLNTLTKGKPHD